MNLGVALAGGGSNRRAEDFYATPPEATEALLSVAWRYMGVTIYEPACGEGDLGRVLEKYGYRVIGTDLVDRGYGRGEVDFLTHQIEPGATIITNPPFKLAAKFIEHGLSLRPAFFALLLKATFWHAASRIDLFERHPPQITLPLTWRLDFTGGGAPTMDCTWFVWGTALPPPAAPALLRKPGEFWGILA